MVGSLSIIIKYIQPYRISHMPSFTDLPPASSPQQPAPSEHVQDKQTQPRNGSFEGKGAVSAKVLPPSKLPKRAFTKKPKLVLVSSQTAQELEARIARKRAIRNVNESLGLAPGQPCPLLKAASQRLRQYAYSNHKNFADCKNAYVLRQVFKGKGEEGFDQILLQALDHICKTLEASNDVPEPGSQEPVSEEE